jgi:hypothetical protein
MKAVQLVKVMAIILSFALTGCSREAPKPLGNTDEPFVNPDPQHYVWIKPGTFTLGSSLTESNYSGAF